MARGRKIYQLRVSLEGVNPPVWRRILVSANVTLRQAHGVICKAMGWHGFHGYGFQQDGRLFGRPPESEEYYVEDDSEFSLRYCLYEPGETLEYAFGSWKHLITLEAIEWAQGPFPWRVIEGVGACPSDVVLLKTDGRAAAAQGTRH